MNDRNSLIFLLFLLTACGSKKSADRVDIPKDIYDQVEFLTQEEQCENHKESLPASGVSGYVSVPENWNDADGEKIEVFYYAHQLKKDLPTVVFFNGGPASSSHSVYQSLREQSHFRDVNIVFIDQRGTGCSSAYYTEEELDSDDAVILTKTAHWGSRAIVQDAEAIRKKLLGEDSKWIVFGQSYGGFIVHRYLALYPESIVSAHSHGYALLNDKKLQRRLRHFSQKRVSEKFFEEYPLAKIAFDKMRPLLTEDVCLTAFGRTTCGEVLLSGLVSYLGFRTAWPVLNRWMTSLINEDGSLSVSTFKKLHMAFNIPNPHTYGSALASDVISQVERWGNLGDAGGCFDVVAYYKSQGLELSQWALSECQMEIYNFRNHFSKPRSEVEEAIRELERDDVNVFDIKEILTKKDSPKLYLYSGALDCFVPPEVFENEVSSLKGLVDYTHFEESGHEGFFTEEKVWQNLLQSNALLVK